MKIQPGTLYVVATPIGNIDDLSPRAREVLAKVSLVAAEDTRHAGQLLTRLGISVRLMSLHEHNEAQRCDALLALLKSGSSIALVSDAGTPLISGSGLSAAGCSTVCRTAGQSDTGLLRADRCTVGCRSADGPFPV